VGSARRLIAAVALRQNGKTGMYSCKEAAAMACDIFVSYAHRDNRTSKGGEGFISRLTELVRIRSEQKYGFDIDLFSDEGLASGTLWEPTLYEQLDTCRVFLPIISPSWANSRWAGKEWDAVWKRVKQDRSLGNQTRIIPVSFEISDGFISSLPEQQKSLQFRRHFRNQMSDQEFRHEVDGLSEDISKLLKKLDALKTGLARG
jgi:hypothetical protein